MTRLKQYKNLLKKTETYDFLNGEDKERIEDVLKYRIHAIEISEKFGGIISDDRYVAAEYCELMDFMTVGLWGKRTLGISDDGRQPNNEWMLSIWLSTGAYVLSREYVLDVFNLFFQELKDLGAAFCDSTNHRLLFYPKDAKAVYEAYPILLQKYRELAVESSIKAKRERLQKELDELK
jgi:hypothetical protein